MPKHGSKYSKLKERLTANYIINNTSVFHQNLHRDLDQRTLDEAKKSFTIFWNSWVKDELEDVFDRVMPKKKTKQ